MKCAKRPSAGAAGAAAPRHAAPAWPIYALVGAAAGACYVGALGGEFVHDDIPAVVLNGDVLAARPALDALRNDFWGTPMSDPRSHKSYRPLTTLSFRLNYLLGGLNPFWFHLTNVLLHATASALFAKTCLEVARLEAAFAALAGLLFAAHPVHTEAVAGVVGRADVLAGVLFLASLLGRQGARRARRAHVLAGALSMLAKETGVTVFLVSCVVDLHRAWACARPRWTPAARHFARRSALSAAALGVLVALRLCVLQGSLPTFSEQDNPAAFHPSALVRSMTFCYLAAFNCWLLLCPATLSHDWQMGSVPLVTSPGDARNLLTCACLGLLLLLLVRGALAVEGGAPVVLGLAMLVLPFLPAANIFVTVGFVVAERILYIPSMGFILLVVAGVRRAWRAYDAHRQTLVSALLLVLACQSLRCAARNRDWLSRESLLRAGIATLPHNAKMHYNYGNFLRDSARYELAAAHYYAALRLWPAYASAHNNLGTLLADPLRAEAHFRLAIRYSKDHLNAHYNLGKLYRASNASESRRMLERCLRIDATFKAAFVELCRAAPGSARDAAAAGSFLRRIAAANRRDADVGRAYAHWLRQRGQLRLALRHLLAHGDAIVDAMRMLRRVGDRGRLLQLITRYTALRLGGGH